MNILRVVLCLPKFNPPLSWLFKYELETLNRCPLGNELAFVTWYEWLLIISKFLHVTKMPCHLETTIKKTSVLPKMKNKNHYIIMCIFEFKMDKQTFFRLNFSQFKRKCLLLCKSILLNLNGGSKVLHYSSGLLL